jgi:superfamily II DNA helicase RecQ
MGFRFFTVPIQDGGQASNELNTFVRSHKVLSVDRRWVEQGPASFWCFCIDYLESPAGTFSGGNGRPSGPRAKVDYREVLNPQDFAVFVKLRDLRKEIAQAEAVPVYTIFTNEQLAQMVQGKVATKAALEKIAGVGDARIDKYGERFLALLGQAQGRGDESNGKTV